MQELDDGIWRFSGRHPEWHPSGRFGAEVAGFALRNGYDTVLVDPLVQPGGPDLLAALDEVVTGRVQILVTIPYHVRDAELLRDRYGEAHEVTIHGHPLSARRLRDPTGFHPLSAGDELPGGIRAHGIGRPRRAEMPLELPSHRALAFGDGVVEVGGGELRVWADAVDSERRRRWYEERFLPTLEALTRLDVDRILVTHGQPVLSGGAEALREALRRPPWPGTRE